MDARKLHSEALVLDGHTDVPTRLYVTPADLATPLEDGHVDLPRLREGGVDGLIFALFAPPMLDPEEGWEHIEELYQLTRRQLAPGGLELAVSADEVRRVARQGGVAVILGLENGRCLSLPGSVERAAAMGVRYVTPTHVLSHEWCDASTDDPRHGGLSNRGVGIVRELGRRGILVDVSHVSDDAVLHVLDVSETPVVASHSSARALCDHPRNLPDELVREIARGGGVVMANTYPAFVDPEAGRVNAERTREMMPLFEGVEGRGDLRRFAGERQRFLAERPLPEVDLERFVDHVVHLIEVAGEEHVGIGTDFDGIPETLSGFADVSEFPALTAALLGRGVDPAAVRLVLGENFLRLLATAERAAG